MSKFYQSITPTLKTFIEQQHLFFTASGTAESRINLSPKGMDTFRILSSKTVAYLDLTGSGNETCAHLKHDGRLTIMFCSFEGDPLILRLYGQGKVIHQHHPDWNEAVKPFDAIAGVRQIIVLDVESVQTSCGYGVPLYRYEGDRPKLVQWAKRKGESGIQKYWHDKNLVSIDGLSTGLLADGE